MSDLPEHEFNPENDFCLHCGVPRYAVVDGIVIPGCGVLATKQREAGVASNSV